MWVSEAVEHETDHGERNHRFGDLRRFLVVFGQTPPSAEPSERSLDHPTAWNDDEAGGARDAADDDQREAEQQTSEHDRQPVLYVSEHGLQPTGQRLDPLQEVPRAIRILDVGRVDDHTEQQARRIHRNVTLAPLHLLGSVVAARAPFSVVFTLCVSTIAAVGLGSRPSRSRSMVRN